MKIKVLKSLLILVLFSVILGSCKNDEDVEPQGITGTWKIESLLVDEGGTKLDYWALISAFYPCTKEITMTFTKEGFYSVSEPAGCVDEDGESLFLFEKTGSYTITNDTKLKITEANGFFVEGDLVKTADTFSLKFKLEDEGILTNAEIKFARVK